MATYNHGQAVEEHQVQDFAPDLAFDISPQGGVVFLDMDQAVPTVKGYQALNQPVPWAVGAPAPEPVLGSTLAYYSNGWVVPFFGGRKHLYGPAGTWRVWDTLPTTPHGLAITDLGFNVDGHRWRFAQFGDDLLAVNGSIKNPQVSKFAGAFTDLQGNPPANASIVLSVNAQVFMFAGTNWFCSALLTDNDWTPNVQTQAGSGSLYDFPGPIVAATPIFRNVIVFKQLATWLGSYVGGYPVWSWQLISDSTGTWCQESVIPMPDSVAFVGTDDFYVTSGYTPQRIPNNLKEWFFELADPNQLSQMLSRYDAVHSICYWYFVSKQTPYVGVPDRYVAWNSRTGRWATGYTVVTSVPYPNMQPGMFTGLFFDYNLVLNTWAGQPSAMQLTTSYFGNPNLFSQVMRFKPIYYVAPEFATVIPYHTTTLGQPDIQGPNTFYNAKDGWFYFRQYDRWHKFQINLSGPGVIQPNVLTGAEISAVALELRPGGWR